MKKLSCFLLSSVLLCIGLGIAGCDGNNQDPNEIVVWMEGEGPSYGDVVTFSDYFTENNPWNYKMTIQIKTSVSAALSTAVMSGDAADLVIWPRWETATQARGGDMLVNLRNRINGYPELDIDDFNVKAVEECSIGTSIYGIPTDVGGWGIWCNMDIFEEVGLTVADLPDVWSDLVPLAQTLTKKDGDTIVRAGFDIVGIRGQLYSMLLTANHKYVKLNSSDVPYVDLDNAAGNAFFKLADDLNKAGVFTIGFGGADAVSNFASGKLAMMYGSNYFEKQLASVGATDMNLCFVPNPACDYIQGVSGIHSGILGGFSLAIPVNLKDTARSWEVMKWWLEKENLAKYTELTGELPARHSLWVNDYIEDNYINTILVDVLDDFEIRPPFLGYSYFEMNTIFTQMDLFLGGNATVTEVITKITNNGNAIFQDFANQRG